MRLSPRDRTLLIEIQHYLRVGGTHAEGVALAHTLQERLHVTVLTDEDAARMEADLAAAEAAEQAGWVPDADSNAPPDDWASTPAQLDALLAHPGQRQTREDDDTRARRVAANRLSDNRPDEAEGEDAWDRDMGTDMPGTVDRALAALHAIQIGSPRLSDASLASILSAVLRALVRGGPDSLVAHLEEALGADAFTEVPQ